MGDEAPVGEVCERGVFEVPVPKGFHDWSNETAEMLFLKVLFVSRMETKPGFPNRLFSLLWRSKQKATLWCASNRTNILDVFDQPYSSVLASLTVCFLHLVRPHLPPSHLLPRLRDELFAEGIGDLRRVVHVELDGDHLELLLLKGSTSSKTAPENRPGTTPLPATGCFARHARGKWWMGPVSVVGHDPFPSDIGLLHRLEGLDLQTENSYN